MTARGQRWVSGCLKGLSVLDRLVARVVVLAIRAYQRWLSPLRPPTCRFYPSCSSYALTAVERFGVARGGLLAVRRLLRCHPWNPGGVDHVPRRGASAPRPRPSGVVTAASPRVTRGRCRRRHTGALATACPPSAVSGS